MIDIIFSVNFIYKYTMFSVLYHDYHWKDMDVFVQNLPLLTQYF